MSDINNQFNKILIHRLLNFQQFQILPPQKGWNRTKIQLKKAFLYESIFSYCFNDYL